MNTVIRAAIPTDYPSIVELYNYYIENTPITFDLEPYTPESRRPWFAQFDTTGRYRLLVAEDAGAILGYAASMPFRHKAAYNPSVETTIYLRASATGQGLGYRLYARLFDALAGEDVHRAYAGITLPNPISISLHEAFGFRHAGTFTEAGRKLSRYWDVAWYEKPLSPAP